MPSFSKLSLSKLATCDERLQRVFTEVIKYFDCTVVCGFRGEEEQNEAFRTGKSQKKWPNGEHNKTPSMAVDVVPFPINWNDPKQMIYFAGFVVGIAAQMGIKIRWGGDWDSDRDLKDQNFNDYPHFEIVD
jgi:peptidoglycan L-alanyl-D-glutamate endopeptidase CwlK